MNGSGSSSSVLTDGIEKDVRPWLKLAEDLRTLNLEADLGVPQICVMGDQVPERANERTTLLRTLHIPCRLFIITITSFFTDR